MTLTSLAFLDLIGVHVTEGDFEPAQCNWCGDVDALTAVRVNGRPAQSNAFGIGLIDVCFGCAPTVISRAVGERDGDHDITVEIATVPAEVEQPLPYAA